MTKGLAETDSEDSLPRPVAEHHAFRCNTARRRGQLAGYALVLWLPEADLLIPCEFSAQPDLADLEVFTEAIRGMENDEDQAPWFVLYLPPVDARGRDITKPSPLAAGIGASAFTASLDQLLEGARDRLPRQVADV